MFLTKAKYDILIKKEYDSGWGEGFKDGLREGAAKSSSYHQNLEITNLDLTKVSNDDLTVIKRFCGEYYNSYDNDSVLGRMKDRVIHEQNRRKQFALDMKNAQDIKQGDL